MSIRICPLMSKAYVNAEGYEDCNTQDCRGENCEWWHYQEECCVILVIAGRLNTGGV